MCSRFASSATAHSAQADVPALLLAPRRALLWLVKTYRRYISPYSPPSCRFTPTCSRYTLDAVRRYGAVHGSWLGLWRILRCNPIHRGGYDPLR